MTKYEYNELKNKMTATANMLHYLVQESEDIEDYKEAEKFEEMRKQIDKMLENIINEYETEKN